MTALRLFVLGLLALSLLLKPVLASMGELHELAHDPSGQHSHVDEFAGDADGEASGKGGNDDELGTLHMLLHFAHCCGHSPAATLPAIPTVTGLPVGNSHAPLSVDRLASALSRSLFRPPIRA